RLGLLDLGHQVRAPGLLGGNVLGAGRRVLVVGDGGIGPRAVLDEHALSMRGEFAHAVRRDGDPVLALLQLSGDADDQRPIASRASKSPMIDLASTSSPAAIRPRTASSSMCSTVISCS